MSQLLYTPGKSPWYLLHKKFGGSQDWSGLSGEEKKPCQEMNPGHPACSLVSILTKLYFEIFQ